jgi:hypothetical protein
MNGFYPFKKKAGGLDLHLGHRTLFVVCSLPP